LRDKRTVIVAARGSMNVMKRNGWANEQSMFHDCDIAARWRA